MTNPAPIEMASPFFLGSNYAYTRWREAKLADYPRGPGALVTEILNPLALSRDELAAIATSCAKTNMAIYRCQEPLARESLPALSHQFGLTRFDHNPAAGEDAITLLGVGAGGDVAEYIPYSDRPLKWHTDGYYNKAGSRIHAFLLHCISAAPSGGENRLLDHEIAYIQLRDRDPDMVAALMADDAMVIPANIRNGEEIREERSGPVFSVDHQDRLHMRYTHRSRSIQWKDDPDVARARECLWEILESSPYIFNYTLSPGEGIVCNNVLHARTAFQDEPGHPRQMFRLRAYDAVRIRQ